MRLTIQPIFSILKKNLVITFQKVTLQKLLFDVHVTNFSISDFTLIVTASTSKIDDGFPCIFFTTCLTTRQVNQTFIVTFKTVVLLFLVVKLVNLSVILAIVQT